MVCIYIFMLSCMMTPLKTLTIVITFWLVYHLCSCNIVLVVCLLVFNATFNNISVISWLSVLLVEETGVPGENHRPAASCLQTLSHNVVYLALSVDVREILVVVLTYQTWILYSSNHAKVVSVD